MKTATSPGAASMKRIAARRRRSRSPPASGAGRSPPGRPAPRCERHRHLVAIVPPYSFSLASLLSARMWLPCWPPPSEDKPVREQRRRTYLGCHDPPRLSRWSECDQGESSHTFASVDGKKLEV